MDEQGAWAVRQTFEFGLFLLGFLVVGSLFELFTEWYDKKYPPPPFKKWEGD